MGSDAAPLRRTALLPWKLRCDGEVIAQRDWSGEVWCSPAWSREAGGREEPERGEEREEERGGADRERKKERASER